jgi:hypothetical protein
MVVGGPGASIGRAPPPARSRIVQLAGYGALNAAIEVRILVREQPTLVAQLVEATV